MIKEWVNHSMDCALIKADFYSGARKILRGRSFTFHDFGNDLKLADCGFTKSKQSMLIRNYLNEESVAAAQKLWERRVEQDKYGSVGFSTYNHYVKGGGLRNPWEIAQARKSGKPYRASVMGPCIQAVTFTYSNKRRTSVDVFYRTTELFKKFPADLVFIRDILLPRFDFTEAPIELVRFHFANITCHPMYFVTLIPSMKDPIAELERIRKKDKYFFDWVVKWTARYLCKKYFRGIEKFAQAMRVRKDALERIDKQTMKKLVRYLEDNHPGYRSDYTAPDEEEE